MGRGQETMSRYGTSFAKIAEQRVSSSTHVQTADWPTANPGIAEKDSASMEIPTGNPENQIMCPRSTSKPTANLRLGRSTISLSTISIWTAPTLPKAMGWP